MNKASVDQAERAIEDWNQSMVPEKVEVDLRTSFSEFRSSLNEEPTPVRSTPARVASQRWSVSWLAVVPTAALLLLVLIVLVRGDALSNVADAIAGQKWIHATIELSESESIEVWYSRDEDIAAWSTNGHIRFQDYRLGIYDEFDSDSQVLTRRGEDHQPISESLTALVPSFMALSAAEHQRIESQHGSANLMIPLGMSIAKQTESDEQSQWRTLNLELSTEDQLESTSVTIRIQPSTNLPVEYEIAGKQSGRIQLDYFSNGPKSIYQLGVPLSATIENQIESNDLQRVLRMLRYGATRMDDYRARDFVVDKEETRPTESVIYRKGYNFRTSNDFGMTPRPVGADGQPLPVSNWKDYPMYLTVGGISHLIFAENRQNGGRSQLVVSQIQSGPRSMKPEDCIPTHPRLPEYDCRPTSLPVLGGQWYDIELVADSKGGPEGCLLLQFTRKDSTKGTDHSFLPKIYQAWVEPQRDFIVRQWLAQDDTGKIINHDVIDELARSPNGTWYAKRFSQPVVNNGPTTFPGYTYQYELDFSFPIPDELFNVPKFGDELLPFQSKMPIN